MTNADQAWHRLGVDSPLEQKPVSITPAPRAASAHQLPLHELGWSDFEGLLWRVMRDVEGLGDARIYGVPGQKQQGIDLVARSGDDRGVALQSKRVSTFGPTKVQAAIDEFRNTTRPFPVGRFVLGLSRKLSNAAHERYDTLKAEMQASRPSVVLELWDAPVLNLKLKRAPQIVIEYFGRDIAQVFCDEFTIQSVVIPPADYVAVREALARTPEVTTGAKDKIDRAKSMADADPHTALQLVEEAQQALSLAGFSGHEAQYEATRGSLLVAVGRGDEATRRRLDQLWDAIDRGQASHADIANSDIRVMAGATTTKASLGHSAVARRAVELNGDPLGVPPELDQLRVGETHDRARLAALAGETALAAGDSAWLKRHSTRVRALARSVVPTDEVTAVRLQILAAEASGRWGLLLKEARAHKLSTGLGALVLARYARDLALRQRFKEADAAWDEATGFACLDGRWTDASRWTFSRRAFSARWNPFSANDLLPVQTALLSRGPGVSILPRDEDALESAYGRLAEGKLRPASIAAQRALREAVTHSDWEGERRARCLVADVLIEAGEYEPAADHLVRAGEVNRLKNLAGRCPTTYLDVSDHLDAIPWWTAGAARQLVAAQADLVPDAHVPHIATCVIQDLEAARSHSLIDFSASSASRYLGGISAIAGLAERLSEPLADRLLSYFEAQSPVGEGHYRIQDQDEAAAAAGIALSHPGLAERAIRHLVPLLCRSDLARKHKAHEALSAHMDLARPLLLELAHAGDGWARETLAAEDEGSVMAEGVDEARGRLEAPLRHPPIGYAGGGASGALGDSVLVRTLHVAKQELSLQQLIQRGGDRQVLSTDRGCYLLAASNLAPPNDRRRRTALFERAMDLVMAPPPSEADALGAGFSHPLGAVQMKLETDSRAQAAYLAGCLARTKQQKDEVRLAALALIGEPAVSEYWLTRCLQHLGKALAPDVGFLSGQDWALKSLAALLWAETTVPRPVGYRLARDPDVRVRRALATALAQVIDHDNAGGVGTKKNKEEGRSVVQNDVLKQLRDDPAYSVRIAARVRPVSDHADG